MTRKLVVEAIGTFFLILTVGLTVLGTGAGALAPLAIGAVLMVMVYAGGHISGAHYNPAVTLAVLLRGRTTVRELAGYWAAHLVAAVLAAIAVRALLPEDVRVLAADRDALDVIIAEFLFTFALVYVVLNTATTEGTKGNSYYGLAIGLTVTAGAYAVGPVSGAVFNPAVALGAALLGMAEFGEMILLIVVQLIAGVAGAFLFRGLDLGDDKPTTATRREQTGLRGAAEPGV
ncbi:MAG TPA: aquaporin [Longimicrobiales bacterium]|nr:aquaporin [Longimicrobiales bacterium]